MTRQLVGPAQRMNGHAAELTELLTTVLILDYQGVEDRANKFSKVLVFIRPKAGETNTLSASIPARFYDLQDRLVAHAKELAEAAHQKNDEKMSKAFGQMSETCVACHSVYLFQPDAPQQ